MPERKNKGGRPPGSGTGQQTLARLRQEVFSALGQLEDDGTPLSVIIKRQLQGDKPEQMLGVLARFLPSDVTVNAGSDFIRSLEEVGAAIDEQVQLAKATQMSGSSDTQADSHTGSDDAENLEKIIN
jgi:hypothetical protein